MGKAVFVSNVSKYTTDRAYNMVRHLKTMNIVTALESEDLYNYCTQYESEAAYAKQLALHDRSKAPQAMDMDVTPFLKGRHDEVLDIDGIHAKLEDLEKEIEYHKVERVLTTMFGDQLTYNDGWVCHKGGELQLSDSEYYSLYKTVQSAYCWMLYAKCKKNTCPNYREAVCKRTHRVVKDGTTRAKIIKRVKSHIVATMSMKNDGLFDSIE